MGDADTSGGDPPTVTEVDAAVPTTPADGETEGVRLLVRALQRDRVEAMLAAVEAGADGVDFLAYASDQRAGIDPEEPVRLTEQPRPWRETPPPASSYTEEVTEVNRVDFRGRDREALAARLRDQAERFAPDDGE